MRDASKTVNTGGAPPRPLQAAAGTHHTTTADRTSRQHKPNLKPTEPGPGARGRAHRGFSRARPHNPRSRSCCPSLGAGYPAHGPSIAAIPFPTTVTCAQNPTKDWLVLDFRKRIFERRRSTGSTVCDVHRLFVRKKRVHRRITRNTGRECLHCESHARS